ncbi:MAG: 50S ribosomal protein L30 [Armatimonadetes bacterium]|nr:50S ribosomal protein L30 [Armatimonadota bacterium]
MPSQLKITLVRSPIGRDRKQRSTVESLGLRRIGRSVLQPLNPQILGMVKKVSHLVEVEAVESDARP